jgi:predicted ATPase
VLVLEDLHWSDHATLDLLSVLARRRERAPLLVLGTYRPLEVILREHPLRAVKQDLQVHELSAQLPLELLRQEQVADYLALRFPDGDLVEGLAEWIYRRTEGHPLFMGNLVEYLIAQGRLVQAKGRWAFRGGLEELEHGVPENLKQMIEQQIAQLRPERQRLLEVASVAGAEFSAALLAHALGADLIMSENACAELARYGQLLRPAGVAEWPDGTVAGRYGFLHAFYPEVLSQRLPPAQRVQLHRRIGECLEEAYGARAGEIAAELAVHFEAGRDAFRAVKYLCQAAENAARRYAHREAIGYLTRALELVGRLPEAERTTVQMRLLEQRGLVRRAMDDMSGAVADFEALLTCAQKQDRAEAEVQAMIQLNQPLFWLDRERSLEIAERALKRSGALQDKGLRAHAEANYTAWTLELQGWQDEEFQRFNEAREVISRSGPARLRCEYTMHHAYLQFHRSRYLECYQTARFSASTPRSRLLQR